MPWFTEARTIYYRTDIFKRAGIDPAKAFTDWDSFRGTLQKISRVKYLDGRRIHPLGQPGKTAWDLVHHVMPFVWDAGGSELRADATKLDDRRTACRHRREVLRRPGQQGLRHARGPRDERSAGREPVQGRPARDVDRRPLGRRRGGRSDDKNWADVARNNFGVAQMPAGPTGKSYTFAGGSNLMLFKSSKNKDEAWR